MSKHTLDKYDYLCFMIQKYILISLFTLLCFISNSQSSIYHKIGEKEFVNTDIYTLLYDETTELIYAGTNRGLFVYKENKFTKLKGPKEQMGNSLFDLKKDKNGDVFCCNISGQIFKVNEQSNTFEIYYELKQGNGHLRYFFTPNNNMFIGNNSAIHIINSQRIEIYNHKEWTHLNEVRFNTFKQQDGIVYFEVSKNVKGKVSNTIYKYQKGLIELKNQVFLLEGNISSYFLISDSAILSLGINGHLKYRNTIFENYKALVKESYFRKNNTSFLALNSQKGYRYFNLKKDTLSASQIIFPKTFISIVFQTKNNKQLFGTFGDGIIVVNSPSIIKYEHDYLFLDIATSPNNNVAVSTRSGEVLNVKNNELKRIEKAKIHLDNIFYIGNNYQLNKLGYKEFLHFHPYGNNQGIGDVKMINDSIVFYISYQNIGIIISDKKAQTTKLDYTLSPSGTKTIRSGERYKSLEWNPKDSLLFFSTNFSVYHKKWSTKTVTPLLYNNNSFTANDLLVYQDYLICATPNEGVLVFKDNNIQYQISKKEGLNANNVKQLIAKDNLLYILTDKGLNLYDLNKHRFIELKNKSIFQNVTDMAMSNDKLWLLEKHSYFSIPLNNLIKTKTQNKELKLFMNRIEVNNQPITIKEKTSFNYTESRFEFIYDYRDVFNKNNVEITYTLEGLYSDWKTTPSTNNNILFQSLYPGVYVFKIKASNKDSSSKIFKYEFEIFPPFWQRWWFYILIALLLIGSVALYFSIKVKKIKKIENERLEKQKLLTDSIDSKLKALRSQMNPHFIFNSLNSIQALILKQETTKSYDYVVLFSDLVRKTLQYSEKDFIAIDDEIAFLENYLTLEALRMKKNFTYTIKYKGKKGIKIPSLMVQPFIENAIHHGLLYKTGTKNLSILFEFDTEMKCTITDNGVGRVKAKEIMNRQNEGHISFSLAATKQRMKILKKQHNKFTGYQIIDLYENKKALGTKVVITLPFNYEY